MGPRRVAAVVGVVLLAWSAWLGVRLVQASSQIRTGIHLLERARIGATVATVVQAGPPGDLLRAHAQLAAADQRLGGWAFAPVRVLPVLGRQHRSLRALTRATAGLAAVSIDGVSQARAVLDRPTAPGQDRVALTRELGTIAATSRERLAGMRLGPADGLVGPLRRGRQRLTDELAGSIAGLDRGATAAGAMADFLTGPRHYLVLAANNAEMRAGSGMVLSAGELNVVDGTLALSRLQSVSELPVPAQAVALPADLDQRWGWLTPSVEWSNLMVSPRFDAMAPIAAQMWVAAGRAPVDGVLSVDPLVLQALLRSTGPVPVEGKRLEATNILEELFHGQYYRYPAAEVTARREALGDEARAAFDAFSTGGWSPATLAAGLVPAARGRHLMAWSANPVEQAGWRAAGVDQALQSDSALVSVLSRGGNKLDPFLHASADLAFWPAGPNTDVTLTIGLANTVAEGEPTYIAGPYPGSGVGEGAYLGILAVSLPEVARDIRVDDVDQLAVAGADGPTRVVGLQLALNRGARQAVTLRFRMPGNHGSMRAEPSARIPPVAWSAPGQRWTDDASHVVRW